MSRKTIGIVGGGQLGRMLTSAAKELGFDVVVVDPTPNCPAQQVGAAEITANLYDKSALKKLANRSDYITVEIEHLDASLLESIAILGKNVNPSPQIIALIKDKLTQKQFLRKHKIPTADFVEIKDSPQAQKALRRFKKMIIKTRHGAYDGRGNAMVANSQQLAVALENFSESQLYSEKYLAFKKELAVMVARSADGRIKTYPVVETVHKRNICIEVLAPAPISKNQSRRARQLAVKTVSLLNGVGVFGIEMFLTIEGKILINEIAPRVHNSGHYTIEACSNSQFEQHIRAISGLPLGECSMTVPAVAMVNILGERNGSPRLTGLREALAMPSTHVHIYGKSPTKIDRKMGHVTATADNLMLAKRRARVARAKLDI